MNKLIFKVLTGVSLVIFASIFISPEKIWLAGILSLLIPIVLLLNTALFIYLLLKRSRNILYPATVMLAGLLFLNRTYAIHRPLLNKGTLSVLSYNVRVFNVYSNLNRNFVTSRQTIDWIRGRNEDLFCFQEFYQEPGSNIFNTVEAISQKNRYYHFEPRVTNSQGAQFGMAIFSKYPMIHRGSLQVNERSLNRILFADIDTGTDTIRVYNVHLESMSIDEDRLTDPNQEDFSRNLGQLISQLRQGFMRRAQQIDNLCRHVSDSPYPVILAGDLNDIPYSYTYQKLKKYLYSSFENGGKGFGFTFNGKLFFLRIDNQFYSDGLELQKFETHRDVGFTDHFPISAEYAID